LSGDFTVAADATGRKLFGVGFIALGRAAAIAVNTTGTEVGDFAISVAAHIHTLSSPSIDVK
jgi:hypothetical protein